MASRPFLLLYFRSFLLITILCLPSILTITAKVIMRVGDTLSTSDPPLQSPSGDFSFGFHRLPNGNTYLPSIWYTSIPDTIVWYAAGGFVVPKGSKLALTDGEGLVIRNPQGKEVWKSLQNVPTDHCALNDTGNLIIWGTDGQSLWESFDQPTDTLLPTQTMGKGRAVYSRHTEKNFTRGRFMMRLLEGDLILNTRDPNTDTTYYGNYFTSNTSTGILLTYNASGHMYVVKKNMIKVELTDGAEVPKPAKDYYFRATLNFDGVLVWYYHEKRNATTNSNGGNTSNWTVIKSIPDNICFAMTGGIDSGACGYNSICNLGKDQRPTCQCPPKFSFVNPRDTYSDCKPDFEVSVCNGEQENNLYRLERLPYTDWPQRDYDKVDTVETEENCTRYCLEDCFCVVAVFSVNTCWKKTLPLSNGRRAGRAMAFIKVRDNITQVAPLDPNHHKRATGVIIFALLGTSGFFNVLLFSFGVMVIWFLHHRRPKRKALGVQNGRFDTSVSCFTYNQLDDATEGFKEELGRGACGIVYKAHWSGHGVESDGSETFVAVKKIDRASLGEAEKELRVEVNIIGQTHHKNLVKMIGFCEEDEHRMLVYEYMSNGSLAGYLFGDLKPSWSARIDIAKGVANGLRYLHEECSTQIIHCDIKPQNILLDKSYQPKISDFGLSKLLKLNQFQTHTAVRGTKGYVAPEWFKNKPIDVKVDVYSFGVLLLEIVSCRRCVDLYNIDHEKAVLTDFALKCYESEDVGALLVDDDVEAFQDMERVVNYVKVAIWCIQEDPKDRPSMKQVSQMLEGVVEVTTPPHVTNSDSFSITCQ